ncbi:MAG: VOC family protein [Lachnospiraceae bacterium]|nr:VOC family protein [Lachnospiraceae bacterium]
MKIHHIGYLVKKIEKAAAAFAGLGYVRAGEITHDEIRKVDILFLQKDGYQVELVSPYSPDSVVAGMIKTYKNSPYHICYEARDFEADLKKLEESGYIRIDNPTAAPAICGKKVVFLMHPAMGMIEVLEN